jgi:hypothetical protein
MRTNRNGVTEVAHLRTNLETYGIEHDRIFKKSANLQTSEEEKCVEIQTFDNLDPVWTDWQYCRMKRELQAKLDEAVKALEFYAGEDGLNDLVYDQDGEPVGYINKIDIELIATSHETVDIVSGKHAREALKKIRGKG